MAKTIKFNIIIDNKPVRSIEDLQENFNLQEILEIYKNGSLKRWLEVRNYKEYISKIDKIKPDTNNFDIIVKLSEIFDVEKEINEIKKSVYYIDFKRKREADLKLIEEKNIDLKDIIKKYHTDYEELLNNISINKNNYPYIKNAINEIFNNYLELFKINIYSFYKRFTKQSILAILTVLSHNELRNYLLSTFEDRIIFSDVKNIINAIKVNPFNTTMYYSSQILKLAENTLNNFKPLPSKIKILEFNKSTSNVIFRKIDTKEEIDLSKTQNEIYENIEFCSNDSNYLLYYVDYNTVPVEKEGVSYINIFKGITEGYWKDLEPNTKKFLIISMEESNLIRNQGKNGEELKATDINTKFITLNGIDYKSNNSEHELVYMEV